MDTGWLKGIAPLLGTALAGPLGGAAAAFLADKLGAKEKTVEAIMESLNTPMTPEQLAGIKTAEIEFKKFLEQNKIDMAKLEVENVRSARDTFANTRSKTPELLSYLITLGFFGILSYMLTMDSKPSEPLLIMLGSLGTAWIAVCNFWFGSTAGSARKTDLLAQAPAIDNLK